MTATSNNTRSANAACLTKPKVVSDGTSRTLVCSSLSPSRRPTMSSRLSCRNDSICSRSLPVKVLHFLTDHVAGVWAPGRSASFRRM